MAFIAALSMLGMLGMLDERLCSLCLCVLGRGVGTLRCEGWAFLNEGGETVLSPWCSVRVQIYHYGKAGHIVG